jgi:hypothetical protein
VPSRTILTGGRTPFLPDYAKADFDRISAATDVYALAVTFWHLLAGEEVLKHDGTLPGAIWVRSEQRDAPPQARRLLSRFIEGHEESDVVPEFKELLMRIPAT